MCQVTQDHYKSLCHHKLTCKTIFFVHDSWKDKKIRLNPCNYLWNQHVANLKIGDIMQPIAESKGFVQGF